MTALDLEIASIVSVDSMPDAALRVIVAVSPVDPMVAARVLAATVNPSPVHLARCDLEDGTLLYPPRWSDRDRDTTVERPFHLVLWLRSRHRGHTIDGLTRHDALSRISIALRELESR